MKRFTPKELKAILDAHYKWLKGEDGGLRANLIGADLRRANLRRANLRRANLIGAAITDPENRCPFCSGLGEVPAPGDTRDCCGFCDGTGKPVND